MFQLEPAVPPTACADVIAWDESVNGSFSSNGPAPIRISFVAGGNDILGSYGVAVAGGPGRSSPQLLFFRARRPPAPLSGQPLWPCHWHVDGARLSSTMAPAVIG